MKRISRLEVTIAVALTSILTIAVAIIANSIQIQGFNGNNWLLLGIFLVILTILGALAVIIQIAHEKLANKPDENKPTTATGSIGIRIKVADEDISVEAPDAESAIVFLKEFQAGHLEDVAGRSIHQENQEQSSETPDVSDTKEPEK